MLWFALQSLTMLMLAGGFGLLIGWLIWGRQWVALDQAQVSPTAAGPLQGIRTEPIEEDDSRVTAPTAGPRAPSDVVHPLERSADLEPAVRAATPDAASAESVAADLPEPVDPQAPPSTEPDDAAQLADADPVDVEPAEPELVDMEPAEPEPGVELGDVEPAEPELVDVEPDEPEPEPAEMESVDAEPVGTESVEALPADAEPVVAGAAEVEPVEAGSVDPELVGPESVEDGPVDAEPGEGQPVDAEQVALEPVEVRSVDAGPVDLDPAEVEPAEVEPVALEPLDAEDEPVEDEPVEDDAAPVEDDAAPVEDDAAPVGTASVETASVDAEPVEDDAADGEAPQGERAEPAVAEPADEAGVAPAEGERFQLPAVPATDTMPLSGRLDDAELLDDLTRIEGITPVMARALAAEGLGSFFAVSNAHEDQLRRALRVNRIRSAPGIAFWAARAGELVQEEAAARASSTGPAPEPARQPPAEKVIDITDAALAAGRSEAADTGSPADLEWLEAHREAVRAAQAEASAEQARVAAEYAARERAAAASAVPERGARPVVITPSAGDELERIEGVGPATAEVLRAAGLTTYAAVAAAHDHELRALLRAAGLRDAPTLSTWSVQAALLLQGDAAGADTLARGLMVGRETS